jgi:hypothetical protein
MPDLLDFYNQQQAKENQQQPPTTEEGEIAPPEGEQSLDDFGQEGISLEGSVTGDPEQDQAQLDQAYSDNNLGPISGQNTRNLYEDPNSWSPAYSQKGFTEEVGTSLLRGVGNHFLKGTGDMLQTLGGLFSKDLVKGTMLSRALQESGTEMADKFKGYLPEDMQAENLTWSSMMDPKFWSVHVAEMIPQLAEFILLSKGGSALGKAGLKNLGKANIGGVLGKSAQMANKRAVFKSGSGLAGKLTTQGGGLTAAGETMAGAVGGGLAGNAFSGLLNSAEIINQNKDLRNEAGELVFDDKDLRDMAVSNMKNNAAWVGIDMLSWGMTFGGGYKALKGMNPLAKGAKTWTKGQQSKVIGSMFAYDVAPIIKRTAKLAGKAGIEGFEEQYQESWEEWAKKKAVAKKTGVGEDDLFNLTGDGSFYEFFTSKENEPTRVLSAAVGALGGGIFNIKDLINTSAENSYRLYDRSTNLGEIVNKQGSKAEMGQQEFFINQSIADLVVDDRQDLYDELTENFAENGNITEEEKKGLDEIYQKMQEANDKADRLNVKGKEALMHNVAVQNTAEMAIEGYEAKAKQNIADIKADDAMSENQKAKKVSEIEANFAVELKAAALMLAEAKQNQANLILGKKVDPLTVESVINEYGEDMVIGGLSDLQFHQYTKEGETDKKALTYARLKDTGKSIYDTIVGKVTEGAEFVKEKVDDFKKSKTGEKVDETIEKVAENETVQKVQKKAEEIIDKVKEKVSEQGAKIKEKFTKEETEKAEEQADTKQTKASEQGAKVGKTGKAAQEKTPELTDADITDEALDTIADLINDEKPLTAKQELVRQANESIIKQRIVAKILGTPKKTTRQPSVIDDLSKNDLDNIKTAHNVTIERTDEGYDIVPTEKMDKRTKAYKQAIADAENAIQLKVEENAAKENDETLSQAEKEFVASESETNETGESLADVSTEEERKAIQDFKVDPEAVKDAANKIGLDKRSETSIKQVNIAKATWNRQMLHKIRNRNRLPETEHISKNELDNYLNQFTTYNLKGPANIHKMAVVNHNLKNMFPNMSHPPQVMITKNLFESVGSIGLGMTLGATIFIDEKAWEQDSTFMHEMSHIYYGLTKDEEETKKLVKAALLNKALVEDIKKKYPDYVQYVVHTPTGPIVLTKGQIDQQFIQGGLDLNALDKALAYQIEQGDIETIPLSKQKYIIEEMFVAQLEGPLSQRFDKLFNTKNEVQRQRDTKKWWGLLRKKGKIIEKDNAIDRMLRELDDSKETTSDSMEGFLFDTFKTVTKGISLDTYGLDQRVEATNQEYLNKLENIRTRFEAQKNNEPEEVYSKRDNKDAVDQADISLEDNGDPFFDDSFGSRVKKATRILRRFGMVYNRALRTRHLQETKNKITNRKKQELFNRDRFESHLYQLALENGDPEVFMYNIENSAIKEVKSFNRFLNKMFPETKLQILNSMHYVLSNSKHIVGFRNTINKDGEYEQQDSLSLKERNQADSTLAKMYSSFQRKGEGDQSWMIYQGAVNRIYKAEIPSTTDVQIVVNMMADFDKHNLYTGKTATYKGVVVPLETLIVGYIKTGLLFNQNNNSPKRINPNDETSDFGVYSYAARPIVEALINTNRKYTPYSVVQNAEGNMEPVKIVNNHLTKEVDAIIEYLAPDENGKRKTKAQFLKRFSHVNDAGKKKKGNSYVNADGTKHVPNQFLEQVYDNHQKGIMPTISQYHGVQDLLNKKGRVYKGSTSLEQGLEDFMTYIRSSTKARGTRGDQFSANIGAFSDSPRKFFMNSKRIAFEEVFDSNGNFKTGGAVINSIYQMHKNMYPNDQASQSKAAFNKSIQDAIKATRNFVEANHDQIGPLKIKTGFHKGNVLPMSKYFFNPKGKQSGIMNREGREMVAEYTLNTIVAGYNMAEVFLPNVQGASIVKRFKMNSSPVMSIKNPNLKLEPVFFADEIINNLSISGTDSAMYILEEDADRYRNATKGVFDLNHGFKFLNASVEKDNPNFKGQSAYLKGYTTIVSENHPLYKIMRARKDKYNAHHLDKYGVKPSSNYTDQTPNHILVAVPQSADKTDFFPNKFTQKNGKKNTVTGQLEIEYTPEGELFTEQALSENIDEAMKVYDELYYDDKGDFMGISAYNFGPQQIMDKKTEETTTPVQLINNLVVGASQAGHLRQAYEIQESLNKQKRKNLQKVLDQLEANPDKEENLSDLYKKLINNGLNKEEMDQAQRILFEENGSSIANPYLVEIITNQLSKTLRQAGNRLTTTGSYSHQKPDSGWRTEAKENKALKGYAKNTDGSSTAAEMVAPKAMSNTTFSRVIITLTNGAGKTALTNEARSYPKSKQKALAEERAKKGNLNGDLMSLRFAAKELAVKRHGVKWEEADKYIGREYNSKRQLIGYHVKGETVIATRVPSSKPGDTGIFEIVGYHKDDGNQVSVSSNMNDIFGSDNDGDTLFIQTKTKKSGHQDWNKALDGIIKLWLSPEMREQISSPMIFEEKTRGIVEKVNKKFPGNKEYVMPFSPKQRMIDYDNTMVAKRNVGPVFNIHKMTNLFASTNTAISRTIKIGTNQYNVFADVGKGNDSRNSQSAILANIILDNAKHGFADDLGLNEHNISQAVLLVNLGVPLEQVGLILNSPAARVWSRLKRNNSSIYHENLSKNDILEKTYDIITTANQLHKAANSKGKIEDYVRAAGIKVKKQNGTLNKRPKETTTEIDINKIDLYSQQNHVLEIMSYLADMNTDIQALGTILGGHKKIHVNPLVLEQQIKSFKKVLEGKSDNPTFTLNDDFKANPDMQNYLDVAEETLIHLQRINPTYRKSTNGVVGNIASKISGDLTTQQIEDISRDVLLFNTARLLGHNNMDRDQVKNLMSQNHPDSVYNKLQNYFNELTKNNYNKEGDLSEAFSNKDNSVLFTQAMNYDLTSRSKNGKYISANSEFTNDSFSEIERERAREEFEQLPVDLQDALITYDLIQNGFKGPLSLAPYFSQDTMFLINYESNLAMNNKESEVISPIVLANLERNIALKQSKDTNNPFKKYWLNPKVFIKDEKGVVNALFNPWENPKTQKNSKQYSLIDTMFQPITQDEVAKSEKVMSDVLFGQPMYINVLQKNKQGETISELYEIQQFTNEEIGQVTSENNKFLKKQRIAEIAKTKMKHIPNNLSDNSNIDIALIKDKNITRSYQSYEGRQGSPALDYMVEATILYEQGMKTLRQNAGQQVLPLGMDAREDFYDETFTKEIPLTFEQYEVAMEFKPYVSEAIKKGMYRQYQSDKEMAHKIIKGEVTGITNPLHNLESQSTEQLMSNYEEYAGREVYAYAAITTPITKQLAKNLIADQAELFKKNGVVGQEQGGDVSLIKAYMMSGSTIPSNHPASQALARMLEKEYKNFILEKKKYTSPMNKLTDALYKEKLGYGGRGSIFTLTGLRNIGMRIKDAVFSSRVDIYNRLYGNMVIREEFMNDDGKLVMNYKLRPEQDVHDDFAKGYITKAEKDFYDFFRKTTNELMPASVKEIKEDYIPHTAMSKLENLSARGLLGLMANSRTEDHAMQDVKMVFDGNLMTWKHISDHFKALSAGEQKNNSKTILAFRKLKQKAKKLYKSGKNEDGSKILSSSPFVETALGFGAINRFSHNRSIKSTELPSMDLNKALTDYIHSTLFVNGNEKFQGFQKLGAAIDGVLAWNQENNLPNMNKHIQKVWKDYFLRQKRQKSFLGPTTDRVLRGLTKLNLFYALGYSANVNTGGLYAIGNVLAGKYHNIKDIGAGAWLKGESRFWGLDKGFGKGLGAVNQRRKRMSKIMKNMGFMDINVYDEVSMEKSGGLDRIFSDLALSPMIYSEQWIQQVHMLGLLTDEQLDYFDDDGNYKNEYARIHPEELIRLEDQVKSSHGRGYQPTDQRAIQMYSWGNMMLQFSRFIPTMVHDRFAKEDVSIYGRETIGTMTAVGKALKMVLNNPKEFVAYRKSLSPEQQRRLDSGLKGVGMATVLSMLASTSDTASNLFWDVNYYWNYPKLTGKLTPAPMRSASNLMNGLF